MKLNKLNPWNWFRHEDESNAQPASIGRRSGGSGTAATHYGEIERAFGGFFNNPWPVWPSLVAACDRLMPSEALLKPSMDISESKNGYTLKMEVPGVERGDVSIQVENGRLTICGEKKHEVDEETGDFHRIERSYGMFRRVLDLPPDADDTRINAKFRNGVLTLKVAKDSSKHRNARLIDVS